MVFVYYDESYTTCFWKIIKLILKIYLKWFIYLPLFIACNLYSFGFDRLDSHYIVLYYLYYVQKKYVLALYNRFILKWKFNLHSTLPDCKLYFFSSWWRTAINGTAKPLPKKTQNHAVNRYLFEIWKGRFWKVNEK